MRANWRCSAQTSAATRAALADAMAARDRECKGGIGKFCREREAAVTERRHAVEVAMRSVEQTADPQTESAIRIVAWASRGMLQPTGDDFANVAAGPIGIATADRRDITDGRASRKAVLSLKRRLVAVLSCFASATPPNYKCLAPEPDRHPGSIHAGLECIR